MATGKEYLDFILEQLSQLEGITHRQMMGEYIIYYKGRIAAYLCDGRMLVKPAESVLQYMLNARLEPPYDGAKPMAIVENVDSREYLTGLFNAMYDDLPLPKPKKK